MPRPRTKGSDRIRRKRRVRSLIVTIILLGVIVFMIVNASETVSLFQRAFEGSINFVFNVFD